MSDTQYIKDMFFLLLTNYYSCIVRQHKKAVVTTYFRRQVEECQANMQYYLHYFNTKCHDTLHDLLTDVNTCYEYLKNLDDMKEYTLDSDFLELFKIYI